MAESEKIVRETYYCCMGLDEHHEQFLRASMDELSELMPRPPLQVSCKFSELPRELRQELEDIVQNQNDIYPCFMEMESHLQSALRCDVRPNLSVLCSPEHLIAGLARQKSTGARWGFSNADVDHPDTKRGWCAATYKLNNKYILWHETLHVLGADDCHEGDKNSGPTCRCGNCIMQYVPTPQTVGAWPFLCQENMDRIKRRATPQ